MSEWLKWIGVELASGLTLLDIEIVSPGPVFFVFFFSWHGFPPPQLHPSWLPSDCSSSKGYTTSSSNPLSENKNLFPHGLRTGRGGSLKVKPRSAWYRKKEECVLHVSWKNVQQPLQVKAKKRKIPGVWNAGEQKLKCRIGRCRPQVKLADSLVPGQPFPIGSFPLPTWPENALSGWIQPLVNTIEHCPIFWDIFPVLLP